MRCVVKGSGMQEQQKNNPSIIPMDKNSFNVIYTAKKNES